MTQIRQPRTTPPAMTMRRMAKEESMVWKCGWWMMWVKGWFEGVGVLFVL